MGLTIELQTETGEAIHRVEDPRNILHGLLPSADDKSSTCLRYIDWYGDTVFNRLQVDDFLREWSSLYMRADGEAIGLLRKVETLALACRDGGHKYLKFVGD